MKLSVKSDYAARAVLGLAYRYESASAVRVEDLAAEQVIPPNYLVQILIELKSQQLVISRRGKEGGYLLARPPNEISLGDILRCVHGQIFESPALHDANTPAELTSAWKRIQGAVEKAADEITFQQLLEENKTRNPMYYI